MIDFDCEEVKRQLNRLAEALPDDEVTLWITVSRGVVGDYTAFVQCRPGFTSECASDSTPTAAVTECLSKTGDRSARAAITNKRKAELAMLESELDPLVMSIDKCLAESETPNSDKIP